MSDNEEIRIMAYHGTPLSNATGIEAEQRIEDMEDYLKAQVRTVFIGGHTHHQMLKFAGKHKIANAGSVGMPFAGKGVWGPVILPYAEYLMLETEGTVVHLSFRQVAFNLDLYRKNLASSRIPLGPQLLGQYQ
jgi:predicted phosphodiesterase